MRWATRAGVHIDRAACAWLIRRFVDPAAEFLFVGDLTEVPPGATPFDMRGVELGPCAATAPSHTLAVSGPLFDGLYEYHRRRTLLGREPA
jgi:hypothetical protein